jgi:hypothetical protein
VFSGIIGGKPSCWILKAVYDGQPSLPWLSPLVSYNNEFDSVSNTNYGSVEQRGCELCEKGNEEIVEPTNNFLVSVVKSNVEITEISPPFYIIDNSSNFPATVSSTIFGVHTGLLNQSLTVTIFSNINQTVCISLIVDGVIIESQTGVFPMVQNTYVDVVFNGVTVSPNSTLEIFMTGGNCL